MKPTTIILALFLPAFFSLNVQAQRLAKVVVTTTTPVKEALEAAKETGRGLKMGSKDYDATTGKITIWKTYYSVGSELQIQVTSEVKENKTLLTLRLPNPANSVGSFIPELKKFVKGLPVANKETGEYFDGVE